MAREIKFRAWLLIAKEMLYMGWNGSTFYALSNLFDLGDGAELMQYTGLKDVNGVEIYEGDLVGSIDYPLEVFWMSSDGVQWEGGGKYWVSYWAVKIHKPFSSWSRTVLPFDVSRDTTVIGNIYETPELLK